MNFTMSTICNACLDEKRIRRILRESSQEEAAANTYVEGVSHGGGYEASRRSHAAFVFKRQAEEIRLQMPPHTCAEGIAAAERSWQLAASAYSYEKIQEEMWREQEIRAEKRGEEIAAANAAKEKAGRELWEAKQAAYAAEAAAAAKAKAAAKVAASKALLANTILSLTNAGLCTCSTCVANAIQRMENPPQPCCTIM
jgi:hypothetical protein